MQEEKLTLASLFGGALQEQADRALRKISENIMDPNTDPEKKRSLTIKLIFKPSPDDNEDVSVTYETTVSLAPEIGGSTQMFITKDLRSGRISVMEHHRGVIRGQLDFGDMGFTTGERKLREDAGQPPEDDATGPKQTGEIIDYQRKRIG